MSNFIAAWCRCYRKNLNLQTAMDYAMYPELRSDIEQFIVGNVAEL